MEVTLLYVFILCPSVMSQNKALWFAEKFLNFNKTPIGRPNFLSESESFILWRNAGSHHLA
jgi:hypothetical protein